MMSLLLMNKTAESFFIDSYLANSGFLAANVQPLKSRFRNLGVDAYAIDVVVLRKVGGV